MGKSVIYNQLFTSGLCYGYAGRGVFRTQSNLYNGDFCEISLQLLAVSNFHWIAPSPMFDWFLCTAEAGMQIMPISVDIQVNRGACQK